jgi:taurine dioxygenase
VQIIELDGVGAEISQVDLRCADDADLARIRQAFIDHGLIFFRDQAIAEEDHITFAEQWGTINVNRFFAANPRYPQIAMVAKEADQKINIGGEWHTDHSYDQEPALGSVLVARELPAHGGDTLFTSMYRAYDALSDGLKTTLQSLNAVHSAQHIFGNSAPGVTDLNSSGRTANPGVADTLPDPVHPVVITHPLSGKQALYVNPTFTRHFEGWSRQESLPLLNYLYQVAQNEALVTRFNWQPGSIAFWDNRATWHKALNDYHGQRRVMHRITIEGGPVGR